MKLVSRVLLTFVLLGFLSVSFLSGPAHAAPAPKSSKNSASFTLNEKGVKAVHEKNFTLAEDFFKKSLIEDSGNLTAVYNLSGMYLANKKEKEAVALLTDYVKQHQKDPGLYARLGDAHFATENTAGAEENYKKALVLAPKFPGLHSKLATVYSLRNDTKKAEEHLLKAVEASPKDGQLLANLAAVLYANSKPEQAVSTAKRALRLKPSSGLYVTLGNSYEALKDYKNSLIAFERARDLGDKTKGLDEKITELKKLAA